MNKKDQKNSPAKVVVSPLKGATAVEAKSHGKTNLNRRHMVGALTGVAAAVWHKPMINSVILPAHAQTSGATQFFSASATASPIVQNNSLLNSLVGPAHAVSIQSPSEYAVKITQTSPGANAYVVDLFERKFEGEVNVGEVSFSGSAAIGASASLGLVDNPCELPSGSLAIELVSLNNAEAVINLSDSNEQLVVPSGVGSLPMAMCVDNGLPSSFFLENAGGGDFAENSIMNALIPTAHAGGVDPDTGFGLSAAKINETAYRVTFLNRQRNLLRDGELQVAGNVGSLQFLSNACSGSGGNAGNPIAASIVSVNSSSMTLELDLDGSLVEFMLPADGGSLVPSCDITTTNFTTENIRMVKQNSLLDALLPVAHAGIDTGSISDFVANAFYSNGSFDVNIVGELAAQVQLAAGYNVAYVGAVPLNTATVLPADDGCPTSATVTIVQRGRPNEFDITVSAGGASTSRVLTPGLAKLPGLAQCPFIPQN